tara:strand:+ start:20 stop:2200 length:2181 start_codon:yes stop_codon:yes gene_type:complete
MNPNDALNLIFGGDADMGQTRSPVQQPGSIERPIRGAGSFAMPIAPIKPQRGMSPADASDLIFGNGPAAGQSAPAAKPKNAELIDDPNRTMGFVDQAKGSFAANDEQWKYNAARSLYPNERPELAMQRFGTTAEGRAFHRGDDGKMYEVQPSKGWGRLANAGEGVGSALPAVTGAVAGIAAMPFGGVASIPAAGIGAYGGEVGRQAIGDVLIGGPHSGYSRSNALKEGVVGMVGQGIGVGLNRWAARRAAPDIRDYDLQATIDLLDKAERIGVRLTPAEATNMTSLIGEQKRLQSSPRAANKINKFAEERSGEVTGAWDRFLYSVGRSRDAGELGRSAKGIATDVLGDAQAARTAAVDPFYEQARRQIGSVNPGGVVQFLAQEMPTAKGSERAALRFVQSQLQRAGPDGAVDGTIDMSFRGLNGAKMAIDTILQNENLAMKQGIDRTAHGTLERARRMIIDAIEASPGAGGQGGAPGPYAAGRALYGAETDRVVTPIQEILAPLLRANPANSTIVRAATSMLDPQTRTPALVAQARALIEPRNPDVWNSMVRQFLHEHAYSALQENAKGAVSNVGGNIAKKVGNDNMEASLRAALPPDRLRAYQDMVDVFRATGRAVDANSDTPFKLEAIKQAKKQARGPLAKIIDVVNVPKALKNFSDWSAERNYQRQAERVAEIFIRGDRDAIMAMRQLRQLGPGDVRRRLVIGHLLGNAGEYGGSEAMDALAQ